MKRRLLSAVLALCMTFTALPITAHAADNPSETVSGGAIENIKDTKILESEPIAQNIADVQSNELVDIPSPSLISGTCGDNVKWKLDTLLGTLTISGSGEMANYYYNNGYNSAPYLDIKNFSSKIRTVTIQDGITSIGDCAFAGCNDLTNVTIPNTVTKIGQGAFFDCSSLKGIHLPDAVDTIGYDAFMYCTSLVSVNIPNKVTCINRGTFEHCESLTDISIPYGVTTIGIAAFDSCNLTSISLPDSITEIGSSAFRLCKSLTHISLPNKIDHIENYVFEGCGSLASIIIPNKVEVIGIGVFKNCIGLENIFIPNNIRNIQGSAFYGCANLKCVYYGGTENDWSSIAIDESYDYNECLIKAELIYEKMPYDIPQNIILPYYSRLGNKSNLITTRWNWELFNGDSLSYNAQLALVGAILSEASEQSPDAVEHLLKDDDKLGADAESVVSENYERKWYEIGYPGVTFGCKSITQNGKTSHVVVIALRGTTNWADIWTDVSSIFAGFSTSADNIDSLLKAYLGSQGIDPGVSGGNIKFFVTGHSLGGAVGNILARKLNDTYGMLNVFAYTFAAPRAIDNESAIYAKDYTHNIFNIMNCEDSVPLWMSTQNTWYGKEYWFERKGTAGIQDAFTVLNGKDINHIMNAATINPLYMTIGGTGGQCAHSMDTYIAFLRSKGLSLQTNDFFIGSKSGKHCSGGGAWCPVDIDIYYEGVNGSELVGRVKDNKVDWGVTTGIGIRIIGDKKYFYFLCDGSYTIKLISTGNGTMTYFAQEIDVSTGDPVAGTGTIFKNVSLTPGKQFTGTVKVEEDTVSGTTDAADVRLLVLDNDGNPEKEVLPDNNGTEIPLIHTVTLDANGGTVSPSALKTDYTGKLNNLPAPSRTGYSFNGWYAEVNGGTQVNTDTVFDKDTTIYARWTYNSNSSSGSSSSSSSGYYSGGGYYGGNSNNYVSYYNITFDANGGIVDTAMLKTGTNGKLSNLPVPNRSDYKFDGWYTAIAGGTLITTDTIFNKNTTVYAHWTHIEESNQPMVPDTGNESKVPDPIPGTPSVATYKKGDKVTDTDSQAIYKITRVAYSTGIGGTVSYVSSTDKKAARTIVPATISLDGVAYKVTKICQNAFKNNLNLKNIVIGKNVETIGNSAFYGCKNLQKATIGGKVQRLWSKVFYKCKNLTKIVIPVKVTTIGKQAFYGCTKLKSITIKTAKLTSGNVGSNAFKGIASKAFVKVPNKVLKKYKKLLPVKGVSIKARIK